MNCLETFSRLVAIDSPSLGEWQLAEFVAGQLGLLGARVWHDEAGHSVPGASCGNLHAFFAGEGEPLLLCCHLDRVEPGRGIVVSEERGVLRSAGGTILGADDCAGIAAILAALAQPGRRRPVELLFTIGEEIGLLGAKACDLSRLQSRAAFVIDSGTRVGTVVTRAPGQNSLDAVFRGVPAHAGVCPEKGISAIQAAAAAISRMHLGRISPATTASVGIISGGTATNIVPECCTLSGEARSTNGDELAAVTESLVASCTLGAQAIGATVSCTVASCYDAWSLAADAPVVRLALDAAGRAGLEGALVPSGGGSDANVLNAAGIPAVVLGAGYRDPHTTAESLEVAELERLKTLVAALVAA